MFEGALDLLDLIPFYVVGYCALRDQYRSLWAIKMLRTSDLARMVFTGKTLEGYLRDQVIPLNRVRKPGHD
jgi:hypothetical protein